MTTARSSRQPRRRPRTFLTIIVLVAVLAPLGYVFSQYWTATKDATTFVDDERTGISYVRPITNLLAALVEAQTAAVAGAGVDTGKVRNAIEEVNRADRIGSDDPLQVRQRWAQLTSQIENALGQQVTGQEALRAYSVPVGLCQALLSKVGDAAKVIRDPSVEGYQLADAAMLRIPAIIISAGELSAQARTAVAVTNPSPVSVAIARDRISVTANAMSVGLRNSTGSTDTASNGDLNLLKPLDEFGAAVSTIVQATSVADLSLAPAQAAIDAAQRAVQGAALGLSAATLGALDSLLATRGGDLLLERRNMLIAGGVSLLGAMILLWLRVPGSAARAREEEDLLAQSRQDEYPPEVVHVGRAVKAGARR